MRRTDRVRLRALAVASAATVVAALTALPAGTAQAVSPDLVISQVYGGGGNSGAPYLNDFVELYNRGTTPVSVTGWTVQYASAAGSSWSKTTLSGTIAPGKYYLVQEAAGAGSGAALPTPDATGTIAMGANAGKIALVTNSTALTCATGCATQPGVKDFVGYGTTASSAEGSPTGNLANTTAAVRAGGGATDTDNNAADFAVTAPTPRNSTSGGGTGGTRIRGIQGAARTSPLAGQPVTGVPGVVTAVGPSGYWFQDPQPDADPATSEALYVYTAGAPGVAVGDSVQVGGTVSEYRPGGTGGTTNLTVTELTSPSTTVLAHNAALPAATVVGAGGRVPPAAVISSVTTGDVETAGGFQPATDGLDFWESLEGMRVQLNNAAVVGPRASVGEIPVVPQGSTTRTARGGILLQAADGNPERVLLDDVLAPTPAANVGDTLSGATVGVIDYSFGNFKLLVTATPTVLPGGLAPETTAAPAAGELSTATFNVENLAPSDPQAKFDGLAAAVVTNLRSPDLVALEEIQDNSGATDNGVVAADQTLAKLTAAITAAGGPAYSYRQLDPVNDQDGGQPGGNIRQVFLYRTDRGLSFTDRPGAGSTTADSVVNNGGVPALAYSPGRIDPTNTAFNASRKPLAGEFRWNGRPVFVIANHFNSKGGDQPLFGRYQQPARPSETQRHAQATAVKTFTDRILAVDPNAAVIVLGDLNDFEFSQTTDLLTAGGSLVDLPRTLPLAERYTYVYEGNSQVLDHILISPALAARAYSYDIVHLNSEFAPQLSDHDPQVVRIPLP
ncbi:lamin tail domain-containing protein [Kitasatospora purpeofusca]|uniref:lamin tail domain-containing protein n=1 Tax=Kitasatospora purpeofusca TaxID=67352 RepID=UPI002251766B|nr:lamin tail domain-containing protein [Kitasatospora purpeofusca]MCX4759180.1 lamin tail domain-containing protein [Kitasatospora purpeofusca]WSR30416.1 lamin tail domain-containing protein [Kitasatospora purpeofusca]